MTTLTARDAEVIRSENPQIKDASENVDGGFQVVARERSIHRRGLEVRGVSARGSDRLASRTGR